MNVVIQHNVRNVNRHIIQLMVNVHYVHHNIVHQIVMFQQVNVKIVKQDII